MRISLTVGLLIGLKISAGLDIPIDFTLCDVFKTKKERRDCSKIMQNFLCNPQRRPILIKITRKGWFKDDTFSYLEGPCKGLTFHTNELPKGYKAV